jgi:hypothetical protein
MGFFLLRQELRRTKDVTYRIFTQYFCRGKRQNTLSPILKYIFEEILFMYLQRLKHNFKECVL